MMVKDAYDVVVSLELLDEIKNLNTERGFMLLVPNPLLIMYISMSFWLFFWMDYDTQPEYLIKNM